MVSTIQSVSALVLAGLASYGWKSLGGLFVVDPALHLQTEVIRTLMGPAGQVRTLQAGSGSGSYSGRVAHLVCPCTGIALWVSFYGHFVSLGTSGISVERRAGAGFSGDSSLRG